MLRMGGKLGVALAGLGLAGMGFAGTSQILADVQAAPTDGEVEVFSTFHDIFPSTSARDWVTNSDYILDVTMTDEVSAEGDRYFTARLGTFTVNEVLLARSQATKLPEPFVMRVLGWAHPGGPSTQRSPVATIGSPRMVPGHRYVIAIREYEPRCSPEDGLDPGGWALVGSSAVIPYDDARLGWGEVEGRNAELISPDLMTLQSDVSDEELSLEQFKRLLERTTVGKRQEQPGVRIGC